MKRIEKNRAKLRKILIVSSEMYPYAKVGGLGDVVASLSGALKKLGHDVRVVIPRYSSITTGTYDTKVCLEPMGVWMGTQEEWCSVHETVSEAGVPVYMIEHKLYFDREGLYHDKEMHDFDDNPARFGFFSRATLQLCKDIGFEPDIIHANDWQTALVPAYLKLWHWNDSILGKCASVLTLHNVAYQGIYPKTFMEYLGLGWHNFTEDKFESYDKLSFLKGGIYYADVITAVSKSFAREITSPFGGFGLAPYVSRRGDDVVGIVNGIDYSVWNPETDPLIPAHYRIDDYRGKSICKKKLQESFGLHVDDHVAVIGSIGRFVDQKGFRLIADSIERILNDMHVQFIILGSGERDLESYFGDLPRRFGGKVGSYIGFDNERAHLIEAGSDFFLMPSLFEPCGLNQMYSQHYGTLPIVRATGGLDDTVHNYDEALGKGTGFKFWEPSADSLYYTVGWAISTYYDRKKHLSKMRKQAMSQDFSWETSARNYLEAYDRAIENKNLLNGKYRPYYW